MFIKMMGINIFFIIITRFREIEVQVAKNQREITFNIFRKLRATKIFRNIFTSIVTILQVAGTILVLVLYNIVADNNNSHILLNAKKTKLVIYGSYSVCISICLMILGYMVAFIIQYRSLMRLI